MVTVINIPFAEMILYTTKFFAFFLILHYLPGTANGIFIEMMTSYNLNRQTVHKPPGEGGGNLLAVLPVKSQLVKSTRTT